MVISLLRRICYPPLLAPTVPQVKVSEAAGLCSSTVTLQLVVLKACCLFLLNGHALYKEVWVLKFLDSGPSRGSTLTVNLHKISTVCTTGLSPIECNILLKILLPNSFEVPKLINAMKGGWT